VRGSFSGYALTTSHGIFIRNTVAFFAHRRNEESCTKVVVSFSPFV
jgi:hypothetical protein